VQRCQQLQHLTILIVISCSIPHSLASLQVLSPACENALAQPGSRLQGSRGGGEHVEVHQSTGDSYQSVCEDYVFLQNQITLCWCCLSPWHVTTMSPWFRVQYWLTWDGWNRWFAWHVTRTTESSWNVFLWSSASSTIIVVKRMFLTLTKVFSGIQMAVVQYGRNHISGVDYLAMVVWGDRAG